MGTKETEIKKEKVSFAKATDTKETPSANASEVKKEPTSEIEDLLKDYTEKATVTRDNSEDKEPEQPKKRGRGRPRKEERTEPIEPQPEIQVNDYINGAMFLLVIDMLFPSLIAFANNRFDDKNKIKASELQLTKQQKLDIEPLADRVAEHLLQNMNPITLFTITMSTIYGSNFMLLKANKK